MRNRLIQLQCIVGRRWRRVWVGYSGAHRSTGVHLAAHDEGDRVAVIAARGVVTVHAAATVAATVELCSNSRKAGRQESTNRHERFEDEGRNTERLWFPQNTENGRTQTESRGEGEVDGSANITITETEKGERVGNGG